MRKANVTPRVARKATPLNRAAAIVRESINDGKKEVRRSRERVARIAQGRASLELLIAVMLERAEGLEPYVHINAWFGKPRVSFDISGADGFKCPKVMRVLEFLTLEFDNCTTSEASDWLYRTYNFDRPDVEVSFSVSVRSDSETCKLVEIGEETRTVKKYKQVCSD